MKSHAMNLPAGLALLSTSGSSVAQIQLLRLQCLLHGTVEASRFYARLPPYLSSSVELNVWSVNGKALSYVHVDEYYLSHGCRASCGSTLIEVNEIIKQMSA